MTMNPDDRPRGDDTPTTVVEAPTPVTENGSTATAPAPTTPVAGPPPVRRTSRLRWLAALGVTAVVVAAAIGATTLLTGESPDSELLGWTPSDSVMYGELRLDLPGDQSQELASFLSAFPGFDDQAALDQKLAEVMDRIVSGATEGEYDYTTDIDPWFNGQIAASIGPLPASTDQTGARRGLVLLGVDDAAAARAWTGEVIAEAGGTSSTTAHGGVEITVVEPPADATKLDMTAAYATFGPVLALGDQASVQAAIDTNGSGSFGTSDEFRTATSSLPGDHIGFMFLDAAAMRDWAASMRGQLGAEAGSLPEMPAFVDEMSPDWVAGAFRADGDALVFDMRTPHLAAVTGDPANHASTLAGLVPADTLVLAASHDVSGHIGRVLALLKGDPDLSAAIAEVEGAAGILGGIEGLTGWIGDLGIVILPEGDGVAGGLVIDPSDAESAQRLLTTLRSFVLLAGSQAGITIRDETHGAATITIITIDDVGALSQLAPGMGGSDAPAPAAPAESVEIAYSVTDDVVVLGSSPSFVAAILDAPAGDTLAENERFAGLVERAGNEHSGLVWVDVATGRGRFESLMPADDRAEYERDARPYVEKLDALLGTYVTGSDVDASTMYVTVSE